MSIQGFDIEKALEWQKQQSKLLQVGEPGPKLMMMKKKIYEVKKQQHEDLAMSIQGFEIEKAIEWQKQQSKLFSGGQPGP